jgi:hypothetical protein
MPEPAQHHVEGVSGIHVEVEREVQGAEEYLLGIPVGGQGESDDERVLNHPFRQRPLAISKGECVAPRRTLQAQAQPWLEETAEAQPEGGGLSVSCVVRTKASPKCLATRPARLPRCDTDVEKGRPVSDGTPAHVERTREFAEEPPVDACLGGDRRCA